ncbi:MAG: AI-2E family transporter [Xanthobacteraceae bacterium]
MPNEPAFAKKILLIASVVAVLLLAWQLADILLLVFASVLGAVLLRALADLIEKPTRLSPAWSLAIAVLLIVTLITLISVLFGATIRENVSALLDQLPLAWSAVRGEIGQESWLMRAIERSGQAALTGNMVSRISGVLGTAVGIVTNVVLVVFSSLYIAAQPGLYRHGFLKLVPPRDRDRIHEAIGRCGTALRAWLFGQVIAMVVVGLLTWGGLSLLSVPSALALGLFAGFAEFVPVLGPIIAAMPALIIAFSQDARLALWVLALFLVIQQIEGNVLQPLLQRELVSLPPAVALFSIVAFAVLFGVMGALLAAPLAIVTLVLVKNLYVETIEQEASPSADEQ